MIYRVTAIGRSAILGILVLHVLAACSQPPTTALPNGPQSWIDAPLPGSESPLAAIDIVSHANHPQGIHTFELSVNGQGGPGTALK